MDAMKSGREMIAGIDRQIGELEQATRERIKRYSRDWNENRVYRQEWEHFEDQVRPLREQREAIVQDMATLASLSAPPPVILPQGSLPKRNA